MPQAEAVQVGVPFWLLQTLPHPPQWPTVVLVSVSQPLAALPSQSAHGATHEAMVQVPFEHPVTAFGKLQAELQAPQ
jgi:hypothetical protein